MKISIIEKSQVRIERYPLYERVNKKIIEECNQFNLVPYEQTRLVSGSTSNVKALQTVDQIIRSPSLDKIYCWIMSLLQENSNYQYLLQTAWVAKYNKGDYTVSHSHFPVTWSFVYCIKSPRGSSPLIFTTSGKRIKAEEGKVVIFPGSMKHHVPKNRCDGRIVLAGNVVPGQLLKDMNP